MSREIIQHAVIRVVQRQIVRYTCDFCGQVCGTRANPKSTWYYAGGGESHYCMKTCHPSMHPGWDIEHVLNCERCYQKAMEAKDGMHRRIEEATLRSLASIGEPEVKKSWYER